MAEETKKQELQKAQPARAMSPPTPASESEFWLPFSATCATSSRTRCPS